ncbi:hypothetical protein [Blastococcus sp. TF02A-26]|uniref:hypothetical protein n=1 Tax=Blastococcus sp. TF02A-26 TaxID=2250577 RepID=UPI000DEBBF0B|nr:hypothetical protein [Blastococcus sp. TF02A-26]RBY88593.1 hypothetical protein DQ240_04055 [Blastococcus sp. TF02A-26]
MTTALVAAVTVVAALLTLAGLASTAARRRIGLVHLALAGVLEALLVAQAVLALVRLAGDRELPETATFLGYLAGALLLPVAGVLFARGETTRWAGTVLAVPAAAVSVMVWRLLQLWEAGRG